ncbi:MAG: DUF4402 domain-containing protein [Prolixibacteraceae bacterium]|jgi:hypothetical protein|nr:DUF4402 domain-containing protein [Prolixibacteraceae bacterium]
MKKLLIVAFVLSGISVCGFAQSNTAEITASVTVIQPIAISRAADLNFGRITIGGAGTVVVSSGGTRTQTGSITLLTGGSEAPGLFNITGRATSTYAVTIPNSVTLKKSGAPTEVITADTFTNNAIALTGSSDQLKVGATIHLVGNETVGAYSSDLFAVTVAYN